MSAATTAPSRRAWLSGAAATVASASASAAAAGAPAVASPEITAAIADYWRGVAEVNGRGVSDELARWQHPCGNLR